MLVSAIITTYNREYKFLKKAIESVINQSYESIEIIVVNDTPHENPLFKEIGERIKEYGDKIKYYGDGFNRGACSIRNMGMEKSRGEFIGFLDDDDEWETRKIEKQVNILQENDYPMVTVNFTIQVIKKNGIIVKNKRKSKNKIITLQNLLKKNNVGGASAPLIRRAAFIKAGGFDESMPAAQDYDLWIRIAQIGDIYYIGNKLQIYNIYDGERISNNSFKKITGYKKLIEKYSNGNSNNKNFLVNKYVVISYHYFKLGDNKNGYVYYKSALKRGLPTLSLIYYSAKILLLSISNK